MYISEYSKVEIQLWNIYLKTYVSFSKQQSNVNWASSKLASPWESISIDEVLAIQVWLILLQTVLPIGCTRKLTAGGMKTWQGRMRPAGRSLPNSGLNRKIH